MQRIEEQLNNAIQEIKKGKKRSLDFSRSQNDELAPLLSIVKMAASLPKRQAPAPEKRYAFLQVQKQKQPSKFRQFFETFKSVYAFGLAAILLFLIGGIGYAASYSLPGQKLFTLKKGFENTRLRLTTNAEERVQLQLSYLDARIQDAQKSLDTNAGSDVQNEAALELTKQTQDTLNNIKVAAASNSSINKNSTILNKVESLTKQQQTLVAKISPAIAQQNNTSNQVALKNIQDSFTAANNDQNVATIPANSDFDITGVVSAISIKKGQVTIDKGVYNFAADKITVQDLTGTPMYIGVVGVNDTIEIKGEATNGINTAGTILLKEKAKVKPSPTPSATSAPTSPTPTPSKGPVTDPSKPQDTFGGFIPDQTVQLP